MSKLFKKPKVRISLFSANATSNYSIINLASTSDDAFNGKTK
jgi:hypothetical protein